MHVLKIIRTCNICVAACNKTYYGDVGKTYDLELHRPKEDKVPYICKLTFNAPGDDFGDIVQVSLQPTLYLNYCYTISGSITLILYESVVHVSEKT